MENINNTGRYCKYFYKFKTNDNEFSKILKLLKNNKSVQKKYELKLITHKLNIKIKNCIIKYKDFIIDNDVLIKYLELLKQMFYTVLNDSAEITVNTCNTIINYTTKYVSHIYNLLPDICYNKILLNIKIINETPLSQKMIDKIMIPKFTSNEFSFFVMYTMDNHLEIFGENFNKINLEIFGENFNNIKIPITIHKQLINVNYVHYLLLLLHYNFKIDYDENIYLCNEQLNEEKMFINQFKDYIIMHCKNNNPTVLNKGQINIPFKNTINYTPIKVINYFLISDTSPYHYYEDILSILIKHSSAQFTNIELQFILTILEYAHKHHPDKYDKNYKSNKEELIKQINIKNKKIEY